MWSCSRLIVFESLARVFSAWQRLVLYLVDLYDLVLLRQVLQHEQHESLLELLVHTT